MRILKDAGLIDRAILNQEIEAILIQEQSDRAGNLPPVELVQDYVEAAIRSARSGDVRPAAEQVIALLSLDLDDLRKAALLSLMVRWTGKGKFDPEAAYVLEKRTTYATGRG